jgi:C1A family cysteine protease
MKRTKRPEAAAPKPPTRKIARYGWVPDLPDYRDFTYAAPPHVMAALTGNVDLRKKCPEVYDQGQIGSCTANAIAGALQFDMMKQGLTVFEPSRLFIYYNERAIEGKVGYDSGAMIRDGIKSVASQGDCPDSLWPYDATPADPTTGLFPHGAKAATKPPAKCYSEALKHKSVTYRSVAQNLADMQGCLGEGFPFVFGFTVYPGFESQDAAKTGNVPMPKTGEAPLGGHAVLAVGFDDEKRVFIVRNSWGKKWGDKGYFYIPYAYLLDDNLSDDFWTIQVVQ